MLLGILLVKHNAKVIAGIATAVIVRPTEYSYCVNFIIHISLL